MKTHLLILSLFFSLLTFGAQALDSHPHEVLLDCTVSMQRMGFNKLSADRACSISAGPECTLLQSFVIQRSYPNCVGDLIYLEVEPIEQALQFCILAARRKTQCVPQHYILDREKYVACVSDGNPLMLCLDKVL
ncbi:MAG: hypothetical protein SGJ18_01055 [Pseudomonadota bacterium]|nr:hypothetical protein [Pseudomonadota bacterium]